MESWRMILEGGGGEPVADANVRRGIFLWEFLHF